jgi:hypothetical protein
MTPNELARKPASEATLYEEVSARLLQASVTLDGRVEPQVHVSTAFRIADLYIQELAERQGGGL